MTITGSCHCGAVAFELAATPEHLTRCNCSLCRRTGGLWAHVAVTDVTLRYAPDAVIRYVQGDKTLANVICKTCGCVTHWEPLAPYKDRMALNFNMVDPSVTAGFRVRDFDGADTWAFLN